MTVILEIELTVDENCQDKASRLLANKTSLSQAVIKDAMKKGAVWHRRGSHRRRLRRASKKLLPGDKLELNYNAELLQQAVPEPDLIHDQERYSVWFKPAGMFCQGSRWGDFASINRWVELNFLHFTGKTERPVFLVHRLDRATSGLMLLCHSKRAARLFSDMFANGQIDKQYQAIVHGDFSVYQHHHIINIPLNGKQARSLVSPIKSNGTYSMVHIRLLTGRKHQIRQHLKALGHPVAGDTLYGSQDNSVYPSLQLQSVSLGFTCPFTGDAQTFAVSEPRRLQLSE